MKTMLHPVAAAILLAVSPAPCFAAWDVEVLTKDRAAAVGIIVRSAASGPGHVRVDLELNAGGELRNVSEVELRLGKGADLAVVAALREDRSKPGVIAVGFTAAAGQLGQLTVCVRVPFRDGGAGGTIYELPVSNFVQPGAAP